MGADQKDRAVQFAPGEQLSIVGLRIGGRLMKRGAALPKTSPGSIPRSGTGSAPPPREKPMSTEDDSREAQRGVAGMAPGSRKELAGARLHEDGRGARADRTGDRAAAAAGADEIVPGSCMSPLVVKAAITAVEGLTLAKPLSNRQVPHR